MGLITDPHTFADGPGNTASGVQVNERFNGLYALVNGLLDAANVPALSGITAAASALATTVSGIGSAVTALQTLVAGNLTYANLAVARVFRAYRGANVSVANGAAVPWDAADFNTGSFGLGTGITLSVAGYYRVSWCVTSASGAPSSIWQTTLTKNGLAHNLGTNGSDPSLAGAGLTVVSVGSATVVSNGSDVLRVTLDHEDPSPQLVLGGTVNTYFHAEMLGRS